VNWAALRRAARSTLMGLGFDVDVDRAVRSLPVGTQQAIEIAKAIHHQSKLVLFDEPTATLPKPDVAKLFSLMRQLRDSGVGILYISHRLDEIYDICDRIVVLRDGQQVATHPISEVTPDQAVKLMLGDRLTGSLVGQQGHGQHRRINPSPPPPDAAAALDVRQLSDGKVLHSVSLTVKAGEAVAVTGLVGSGQSELGACLFGARRVSSGQIRAFGREVSVKSPRAAIRAGLAWVPEERKSQGLVLGMSVSANLALASIAKTARHGLLFSRAERRAAEQSVSALGIKTPSVGQKVGALSGGNQQKVVLGKWLLADSKIMVASEPTRGVDVAAKDDIYGEIRKFLRLGGSVLILTAELDEALLCDRVYVISQGRIAGEFEHNQIDSDRLVSMLR
jgi:ribose transport system ATP-binding protein